MDADIEDVAVSNGTRLVALCEMLLEFSSVNHGNEGITRLEVEQVKKHTRQKAERMSIGQDGVTISQVTEILCMINLEGALREFTKELSPLIRLVTLMSMMEGLKDAHRRERTGAEERRSSSDILSTDLGNDASDGGRESRPRTGGQTQKEGDV